MTIEANRICPFCAETVKSKAKLCPRCRQWLTIRSLRHPIVNFLVLGVPMVALIAVIGLKVVMGLDRVMNPKPYYSEFPGAIRVIESRMNWVKTVDGTRIYITGVLTNTAPVGWKDVEFDCRFYDKGMTLLDAGTGYGRLTVGPDDDAAFRVAIAPAAPTNDYASYKISVSSARNSKSWF